MRAWVAGVLGAGLILAGCGVAPPAVERAGGYATPATPYGALLPRYTREAQLYDGFDTVAKGFVTWRSAELRQAAVAASVVRYHLEEAAAIRLRAEQQRELGEAREFHLALYTPRRQWNDLEADDTLWRAYLELPDGRRVDVLEIEALRKTDKSVVEYPYVTPWTREYRLRFPRAAGEDAPRHLTVVLAGALGSLRFPF